MAPTPITKTVPVIAGVAEVAEATLNTVDGNTISEITPKTIITIRNADASNPHTVTFVTNYEVGGLALEDKAEVIPAASTRHFADFDPKYYGRTLTVTGDSTELKIKAMQA